MASSAGLKKPIIVWFLGFCFLLAPLGNMLFSLYSLGYDDWYGPQRWAWLLSSVGLQDLVFFFLILLAGVALFFQTKTSWFVAVIVLLIVAATGFLDSIKSAPGNKMEAWTLLSNLAILIVLFYFRYPYLDKRDHVFEGIRGRFPVEIPVQIEGAPVEAAIDNISAVGCHIRVNLENFKPEINSRLGLRFTLRHSSQQETQYALSLIVSHFDGSGFGGPFVDLDRQAKKELRRYCSELSDAMKFADT